MWDDEDHAAPQLVVGGYFAAANGRADEPVLRRLCGQKYDEKIKQEILTEDCTVQIHGAAEQRMEPTRRLTYFKHRLRGAAHPRARYTVRVSLEQKNNRTSQK